jgi:hypothetical protein
MFVSSGKLFQMFFPFQNGDVFGRNRKSLFVKAHGHQNQRLSEDSGTFAKQLIHSSTLFTKQTSESCAMI